MAPFQALVWLAALGCTGSLMAAALVPISEYEGRPIVQVRYDPPTQPVVRADLTRLVALKEGELLRLANVQTTIKRLYTTGEYADIEVSAAVEGNGVAILIRTTEQWFVGPVEVRGKISVPPNEGQLSNAGRLELGRPFAADADLTRAVVRIKDLLERNGLYRSQVAPEVARDAEHQQIAITFRVESGKRARLTLPLVVGDTRIPPADLARAARYKRILFFPWKFATADNVQGGLQSMRRKYEKDGRLTSSVRLLNRTYLPDRNRVQPRIEAAGGPKVTVETGGAKVSKGDLRKYVPIFDENTVNRDLLVRGVANLRDYFQDKGYFNAQVDFTTSEVTPDLENITYTVRPGERHKLVKLNVTGNRYFTADDIRQRMYIQPAGVLFLRHGRFSTGLASHDEDAIEALYRANGFRDAKAEISSVEDYQGKRGAVAATVRITEGAQYLISSLRVNGMTLPDRNRLLERLASIEGQPFSEDNVAQDRDYLLEIYQSRGHLDTRFDWSMTSAGPHQVALEYTIAEGPPRYVRDVLVSGLHTTRRSLVEPHILLKSGDPLSWTTMGEMQRQIYNLGIFDQVDMAVQNPQGDTRNKFVLFHLTEGHRYYMGIGAGAELARIGGSAYSLDNPAGTTGFAPHGSFEISRLNMFGLGHSLNFKSGYSTLDRRASLNYLAPRFRNVEGRNISINALYDDQRDVLTFTARRLEGSIELSEKISKPTTVFLRYTWRNVQVDESTLKINPVLIPAESQAARIAMISVNVVQDRRDNPADPHRGIYNSADLGLVNHYFGGSKNFLRFLGRNSYYKQIGRNYVLASNTQFGIIKPYSTSDKLPAFEYVPLPERFFGGGSYTNRAFPDFQAGPRDLVTGFPLGGNALLFHSTELRFPLLGANIGGVLFHDFGNVYSSLGDISFRFHQRDLTDFNYTVHAVGLGIRYRTPVGPVRVDLAYSLNPPTFNGLKGTYDQLLFGGAIPTVQSVGHFQYFISIGQAF